MATPNQPSPLVLEELHNDTQRALALTVNAILAEGLRGDDALDRIVEDIQPAVLFHPDVRSNAILYRKIRDIYIAIGVNVERRHGYQVIKALACVYPEGEIRDDALARLTFNRPVTTQHTPNPTTSDAPNYASRDNGRAVASILSMYKTDSAKYGGTIDENFQEAFDRYLRAIEDLQLPTTKGLQLLHNMLTGEALSFFSSISATCQTLSDARTHLEKEFMSAARQNAARRELDSLDFRTELASAANPMEALEAIRTTITRVISQCPERYRGEKFRIDFLRRALQSEPWAADPIARADGDDHTFTQFYNNVATRLTLATQNKTLLGGSTIARPSPSVSQLPIPSFYGERITYTPPHKRTNESFTTPPRMSTSSFTRSRACFNCGSLDHLMARCPRPRSAVKAGRAKLLTTPAAELLFEALDQFDQESCGSTAIAEDTPLISRSDEVALFDTLLARSIEHRLAPPHSSDPTSTRQHFPSDLPASRHPEEIDGSEE